MFGQRKILFSFFSSLIIHFLLLCIFAWLHTFSPQRKKQISLSPDLLIIKKPSENRYIDTDTLVESPTPPPDTPFYSHKDTLAKSASPIEKEKDTTLPNQEVKQRLLDHIVLQNQSYRDGSEEKKEIEAKQSTFQQSETAITEKELSMVQTQEITKTGKAEPIHSVPPEVPLPSPHQHTPQKGQSTFKAHRKKTKILGSVSRSGRTSIDARKTAEGKYAKALFQAVAKEWHRNCYTYRDFIKPGHLRLEFKIDKEGTPHDFEYKVSNGGAVMKDFTINSVKQAKIPPLPQEVLQNAPHEDTIEITYDFFF